MFRLSEEKKEKKEKESVAEAAYFLRKCIYRKQRMLEHLTVISNNQNQEQKNQEPLSVKSPSHRSLANFLALFTLCAVKSSAEKAQKRISPDFSASFSATEQQKLWNKHPQANVNIEPFPDFLATALLCEVSLLLCISFTLSACSQKSINPSGTI